MSVFAAAVSVSTPLLTRHPGGGLPAGSSANGRLGSFNAVTRVVCHDPVAWPVPRRFRGNARSTSSGRLNPREFPEYHPGYYGVFLRDLDGHNVEAVHHG
jgi:hypothetical protein